jgi:hypothetical protein
MSQPDFNPFDPISAAMGAMHGQNLLAAKDARIKQLEDEVERLTKAGDGLQKSMLEIGCNEMADNFEHDAWWASYYGWNAAKDGNANG